MNNHSDSLIFFFIARGNLMLNIDFERHYRSIAWEIAEAQPRDDQF